jgi:hypothetical protein
VAPFEVIMLVPAIAFSSWLVAIPLKTHHRMPSRRATADAIVSEPSADRTDSQDPANGSEDAPTDSTEVTGERVLYRGTITAEIARVARTFLDLPMGAERAAEVEGHRFVFVLERHFHPLGFVGAPNGWHKGVTVYELR